jgi:hypothetical protein
VDRSWINKLIRQATHSAVVQGPFAGMRMCDRVSRGDGDIAPKLLGTYEEELHPHLNRFCTRSYSAVMDVGCAEGYYAIGCARLFSGVPVFAFDSNPTALEICQENAALNCVTDRIITASHCVSDTLASFGRSHPRSLAILDCEGYEKTLFTSDDAINGCVAMDLIIECHDKFEPDVTPYLVSRLIKSHQIQFVYASGRNPNAFPFLSHLSDWDRWMAACEFRQWLMHWLICESRLTA